MSADLDAAARVAALTEKIATLQAAVAEKHGELMAARKELIAWRRVDVAIQAANGVVRPPHGPSNMARGADNRRLVLDCLVDGRARSIREIADSIHRQPGTIGGVVARLVKAGELDRPSFSTYRLKSASPPSRPVPVAAPAPAPARDASDATLIPGALLRDAQLEPIRGAAPQSRCPKCLATSSLVTWAPAIGLRNGRYVYSCPKCRATFHANADERPK